jgi:hypothetical protein
VGVNSRGTHPHHGRVIATRIEAGANAIDVAERGKELERSGKKTLVMKEIHQPLCAGSDEAVAYLRRDDCANIDQKLGPNNGTAVRVSPHAARVFRGSR